MEDEAVQDKYDADNVEHKPGHIAYLHEAIQFAKIAIYPQRFDRSLRNLVRWCIMGLLTAPTVKTFEFHKSKMADSRHFENR